MNRKIEVLLTLLALAGLYSAIPIAKSHSQAASAVASPTVQAEQVVIVADGSDPMPLCRKRHCSQ